MSFDKQQSSYREFRDTLKQHTNQVVVWCGAGLSQPSGLPNWPELRAMLTEEAKSKSSLLDASAKKKTDALISLAEVETDLWIAFGHLKRALGDASYAAAIKAAFSKASTSSLPKLYEQLWSLGIRGFLTLNIDRFASRAFSVTFSGKSLREFEGVDAKRHTDVLQGATPFVANLHGSIEDQSSWIFTNDEFENLIAKQGYKTLVETCFTARTILFVGISADDQGATKHLQSLKTAGLNLGAHYWLTNRNDLKTTQWAETIGLRQILYKSTDGTHGEIEEFIEDLTKYVPLDLTPLPVTPATERERGYHLLPPEEIELRKANEIRILLNKEAVRILESKDPNRLITYQAFWDKYQEAIYRAWSVTTAPGKNMLFDYVLQDTIAKGAFGCVYKAIDAAGGEVAIKILHGNVKEEPQMLECFRRGVAAMKILSDRGVAGMVPYISAWEIPTCTVMELIQGPNLEEAVKAGYVDSWVSIIRIASDIVSIIRSAHQLPERVLHRDIRPANIMLKGYYDSPTTMQVVVLDFDLSWHRDASGLSVNLGKSSTGYVAPEQIDQSRKKLTRNSLVDSFGVGMTLYFLATGVSPKASQHQHRDWEKNLQDKVSSKRCSEWLSLPRRFARLIKWSTQDTQSHRWDMTRIQGELERLSECVRKGFKSDSIELVCEEMAARCLSMSRHYEWDGERGTASLELKSGFTVKLITKIEERRVVGLLEWLHAGDRSYKDVRKFIGPAADKVCAYLRSSGWVILNKGVSASQCRIEIAVAQSELASIEQLERRAKGLSTAIDTLRFD